MSPTVQSVVAELEAGLARITPAARLEAELLVAQTLSIPRWRTSLEPQRPVASGAHAEAMTLLNRRLRREPIQYVLGRQEFWGLEFHVGPGVFIPRPESETVVEEAVAFIRTAMAGNRPICLDLGTGSGCLAVALAVECPEVIVYATDRSLEALRYARINITRFGLTDRVRLVAGHWAQPLANLAGQVSLVMANPPYIPTAQLGALAPEIEGYEPRLAVDGGPDGLWAYRQCLESVAPLLRPDAAMVLEVGQTQTLRWLAAGAGDRGMRIQRDLAGLDRVVTLIGPWTPS